MVVKTFYATRADGVSLYLSKSDQGLKIHKVGTDELYDNCNK